MNIRFLPRRAFSLKPLLLKSSKMNSHTEISLFVRCAQRRALGEKVGSLEEEKELASQRWSKTAFLPPGPALTLPSAKTAWNYLKFYTTIGLLLTPCQRAAQAGKVEGGGLPVGRLFRVWSTPTARMPSALELLIFTGVARRTKGRVRACRQSSASGFFSANIRGREGLTIW